MNSDKDGKDVSDTELIARYVEPNPDRPRPADVRLVDYGVPVWALIGHYLTTGRDEAYVAESYEVPLAAVRAALAYYRQHQTVIDARLAANAV
jgi:uncharacterized protein (DUF433 family)